MSESNEPVLDAENFPRSEGPDHDASTPHPDPERNPDGSLPSGADSNR